MRFARKFSILSLLIVVCSISGFTQITVTNSSPNNVPSHLIQNVFMGAQINAFNFSYNGSSTANTNNQIGVFHGGGNIIGIDSGIVMSTGNIASIPNNGFASTSYSGSGDNDVLTVAQSVGYGSSPSVMRDKAVLEFDFVAPQDDSVAFEYAFGSDEWTTWPCSVYNDAFGFFISGPGISSGNTYSNNAVNVSIVPGTTSLPVSIASIHDGTASFTPCSNGPANVQFFNMGATSNPFAFAKNNNNNNEGAFTDVFMTNAVHVNACDTYHVKLAICDGTDWGYDSAVFLKAKSFDFFGITVNPQPAYNPWGYDTALVEGCGDLDLFFTRSDSTYPEYTLTYEIAGNATMGIDYETIPGCTLVNGVYECEITFEEDSTTVGHNIEIYFDNLVEGYETFLFIVTDPNVSLCGDGDTLALTIVDQPVLQVTPFGNTTLDCNDGPAYIGVTVTGLPPFTFEWNNAVTDSTQSVQPAVTSIYTITVEDGCGEQEAIEFVTVGVFNVPWSVVKIGDEQTINCTSSPVQIGVGVQFNDNIWHGDITYAWSTGATTANINVFSVVDTTYSVTITRGCTGETVVKSFKLFVENDPVVLYTEDTDVADIVCPGDTVGISVSASGGYPPYNYSWSNGATNSFTSVGPLLSDTFHVTVTDVCGLEEYVDFVYVPVPVADPLEIGGVGNDTVPCAEMKVHFGPVVPRGGFGWGYEVTWTDFKSLEDVTQKIIYGDTPFTVNVTDGCHTDTAEFVFWGIIGEKNDLQLSLTQDTTICLGDVIVLEAKGIDGGGKYQYFWNGSESATGKYLSVNPTAERKYTVRMTDLCDTVRQAEVTVGVSSVEADFEFEYINDYEVVFRNKSWSADSIKWYNWKFEELPTTSIEENPIIKLPNGNPYTVILEVVNEFECRDVATTIVTPEYHLYIPSSFTPDNDGINEVWSIESLGIREMKLEVYNRWGDKVFETTDKNFTWDGKYQGTRIPMGAYAWRMVLYTDHDEYVKREGMLMMLNDFKSK
jgi:gliding motility-associated-like protein